MSGGSSPAGIVWFGDIFRRFQISGCSRMNLFRRSIAVVFAALLPLAAVAADMSKTLRITFQVAETGFDPVKIHDYYSGTVIEASDMR